MFDCVCVYVSVCVSDESVIGGLSLLLMAGQQTVTVTASPMMTERKPNNLLLNTVTLGSHEDVQSLTQQVNYLSAIVVVLRTRVVDLPEI